MAVVKTTIDDTCYDITQHWTSESIEEMRAEFYNIERNYPTSGYGTCLYGEKLDPTGMLWHAEFYRSKSCD